MKEILLFILLIFNQKLVLSENSSYDYSSYTATSTNNNLSSKTISSTTDGQSAVYITQSGITITDSTITKSGDFSGNTESSEFYGLNAAILVQGGGLTMTGGTISNKAKVSNAIVATNGGTVTITGTTITSTGSSSARGLHATYGGCITANEVTISTTGGSCATLATDRGEGTVTCTKCTLTTGGAGSPLIYSTGEITVTDTTGTANAAQVVVVEGKNSANIKNSNLKCTANGNNRNDECGVLIYQSMSGDADTGTGKFTCESSTLEVLSKSSVYSSAPFFYVTNTEAEIALNNCTINYGSGKFLLADGGSWGTNGTNGGIITMTLKNQKIKGNIVVGSSSALTLTLINSSIEGIINTDKTAAKLAITLDADSSITLTGNSYYTSLTNSATDNSNIVTGSYSWNQYEESSISTSGGTNSHPSGSGSPPSGSGSPPSGSGSPPSGSGSPPSGSGSLPSGSSARPSGSSARPSSSGSPPSGSSARPSGSSARPSSSGSPPSSSSVRPSGSSARPSGSGSPPSGSSAPPSGSSARPSGSNVRPSNSSSIPSGSSAPPSSTSARPSGSNVRPSSSSSRPNNSSAMPSESNARPSSSSARPSGSSSRPSSSSAMPSGSSAKPSSSSARPSGSSAKPSGSNSPPETNTNETSFDTKSEAQVVLLGFSHLKKNNTDKNISFNIYFIRLLNSTISKNLTFPITVTHNSALRFLQNSEEIQSYCTLNGDGTESKLQYNCAAQATSSNIGQIKINPTFNFGGKTANLAGITPLANNYINNIEEVGEKFDYLSSSDVYILDNSVYNKHKVGFYITGEISDPQPNFKTNDNLVLNISLNNSGTISETVAKCVISNIKEKNYTLNCEQNENVNKDNLQVAYSEVDESNILLVNFVQQSQEQEEKETIDTTTTTIYYKSSSGGLSAGAIVAIVLACIIVLAAITVGVILFTKKKIAKKPIATESSDKITE